MRKACVLCRNVCFRESSITTKSEIQLLKYSSRVRISLELVTYNSLTIAKNLLTKLNYSILRPILLQM